MRYENRNATPKRVALCGGLKIRQVDRDKIAGRANGSIRIHMIDKRPQRRGDAGSAD